MALATFGTVSDPYAEASRPASTAAPSARRAPGFVVTVVAALIAGALGGAAVFVLLGGSSDRLDPLPQAPFDDSPPSEDSIAAVAERVLPVVVTINTSANGVRGSGSGFVLDNQGHILTNNHVISEVADDGSIVVVHADDTDEPAELVGRSISYDLAVLRVEREDLVAAALGNSDNVRVGDTAIAIGAPLGLSETVTQGIISALNRPVTAGGFGETAFISVIQTDAAINPGNSGGPLLNGSGEVIGVNSAIATIADPGEEGGSIGLGFSIPINQALRVAEEIIETGAATTPVIDVTIDLDYSGEGARIAEVAPGGPADVAGLAPGDVVVAVDGVEVAGGTEAVIALRSNAPGDTVELTLADGSTVDVVLAAREES
jgi:putative serine protease PepD